MQHNYLIRYKDIVLRSIQKEHLELLRKWRNKDKVRKWFIYQNEISEQEQIMWYEQYVKKADDLMFIVEWNGVCIGCAALYHINEEIKNAEFGRLMIGEDSGKGKSIGTRITYALCEFGFNTLGLEEIYLHVFKDNTIARSIYEKLKFESENSSSSELLKMVLTKLDFKEESID